MLCPHVVLGGLKAEADHLMKRYRNPGPAAHVAADRLRTHPHLQRFPDSAALLDARDQVRRKHALDVVASESGFSDWLEVAQILKGAEADGLGLVDIAWERWEHGDIDRAAKMADLAIRLEPNEVDAYALKGISAFGRAQYREAYRLCALGVDAAATLFGLPKGDRSAWRTSDEMDLDVRPFERCLHGQMLSAEQMGNLQEARELAELFLNLRHRDRLGTRYMLLGYLLRTGAYDAVEPAIKRHFAYESGEDDGMVLFARMLLHYRIHAQDRRRSKKALLQAIDTFVERGPLEAYHLVVALGVAEPMDEATRVQVFPSNHAQRHGAEQFVDEVLGIFAGVPVLLLHWIKHTLNDRAAEGRALIQRGYQVPGTEAQYHATPRDVIER